MTTLAAYLHQIDPVAFSLFGLKIRWYGLSYLSGFLLAGLLLHTLGRKRRALVPPQFAMDAILILIFGVVVGGRLGYVLFYQPSLATEFSNAFPYWGVLAIHKGGMASHGGMLGVLAACWTISRGFRTQEGPRVGFMKLLGRTHDVEFNDAVIPLELNHPSAKIDLVGAQAGITIERHGLTANLDRRGVRERPVRLHVDVRQHAVFAGLPGVESR